MKKYDLMCLVNFLAFPAAVLKFSVWTSAGFAGRIFRGNLYQFFIKFSVRFSHELTHKILKILNALVSLGRMKKTFPHLPRTLNG